MIDWLLRLLVALRLRRPVIHVTNTDPAPDGTVTSSCGKTWIPTLDPDTPRATGCPECLRITFEDAVRFDAAWVDASTRVAELEQLIRGQHDEALQITGRPGPGLALNRERAL